MTDQESKKDPEFDTIDAIIDHLKGLAESHEQMPPERWLDAGKSLLALLGNEQDRMYDLQQKIAAEKVRLLEADEKHNASAVKIHIEATDDYVKLQKQKARVERVIEFIRIAKIQSKMRDSEYGSHSGM